MEAGAVIPRRRRISVYRTRPTLVFLVPSPWRGRFIWETMFSVSFGLSFNPVSWGSSKVLSSIVATEGGDGFFLLALLALLFWTIFHPSGGGEVATEAEDGGGLVAGFGEDCAVDPGAWGP